MNLFNRVLVVVLALLGLVIGVATMAALLAVPNDVLAYLEAWVAYFRADYLWQLTWVGAAVGGVLSLISLAVLILEFSPRRRRLVELSQVGGGLGMVTVEAVAQRVRQEVEAIDQVKSARPRVTSRGREVDVNVGLRVDPAAAVAAKTEEVCQVVRQAVETGLGVKLRRLEVEVEHDTASRPA